MAFEAEQAANYPQRLMALLERATKQNFEIEVQNAQFVVVNREDRRKNSTIRLTITYSNTSQEALEELEWRVGVEFKKQK